MILDFKSIGGWGCLIDHAKIARIERSENCCRLYDANGDLIDTVVGPTSEVLRCIRAADRGEYLPQGNRGQTDKAREPKPCTSLELRLPGVINAIQLDDVLTISSDYRGAWVKSSSAGGICLTGHRSIGDLLTAIYNHDPAVVREGAE